MTDKRWLKTLIKDSKTTEVKLPWARGAQRAALIARFKAVVTEAPRKAA